MYYGDSPFPDHRMLRDLDAPLIDLAIQDYQQLCELFQQRKTMKKLVDRSKDPVRRWRDGMGRFIGNERLSAGSLQLKRICDREVNLNDEGEVDKTVTDDALQRITEREIGWVAARAVGAA